MNIEIANALSIYFETLYEMNRRIIAVCGKCEVDNGFNSYKLILDVIEDIPKIIPYSFNKKEQKLCLNHHDGLLEFKKDIDFLECDYGGILYKHNEFLDKIRRIRNKIEHKMHAVENRMYLFDSSAFFHYDFSVENNEGKIVTLGIDAKEFINLLRELNFLFSKLQNLVKTFAEKENKTEYPYYKKLCRFDFIDFNEIYKSNLLGLVGEIFVDF